MTTFWVVGHTPVVVHRVMTRGLEIRVMIRVIVTQPAEITPTTAGPGVIFRKWFTAVTVICEWGHT